MGCGHWGKLSLTSVLNIGNISSGIISNSVGNSLDATIGKINAVLTVGSISITGLVGCKVGTRVVISYSITVVVVGGSNRFSMMDNRRSMVDKGSMVNSMSKVVRSSMVESMGKMAGSGMDESMGNMVGSSMDESMGNMVGSSMNNMGSMVGSNMLSSNNSTVTTMGGSSNMVEGCNNTMFDTSMTMSMSDAVNSKAVLVDGLVAMLEGGS